MNHGDWDTDSRSVHDFAAAGDDDEYADLNDLRHHPSHEMYPDPATLLRPRSQSRRRNPSSHSGYSGSTLSSDEFMPSANPSGHQFTAQLADFNPVPPIRSSRSLASGTDVMASPPLPVKSKQSIATVDTNVLLQQMESIQQELQQRSMDSSFVDVALNGNGNGTGNSMGNSVGNENGSIDSLGSFDDFYADDAPDDEQQQPNNIKPFKADSRRDSDGSIQASGAKLRQLSRENSALISRLHQLQMENMQHSASGGFMEDDSSYQSHYSAGSRRSRGSRHSSRSLGSPGHHSPGYHSPRPSAHSRSMMRGGSPYGDVSIPRTGIPTYASPSLIPPEAMFHIPTPPHSDTESVGSYHSRSSARRASALPIPQSPRISSPYARTAAGLGSMHAAAPTRHFSEQQFASGFGPAAPPFAHARTGNPQPPLRAHSYDGRSHAPFAPTVDDFHEVHHVPRDSHSVTGGEAWYQPPPSPHLVSPPGHFAIPVTSFHRHSYTARNTRSPAGAAQQPPRFLSQPLPQPGLVHSFQQSPVSYSGLENPSFSTIPDDIAFGSMTDDMLARSMAGDVHDDHSLVSGDGSSLPTRRLQSSNSVKSQARRPSGKTTATSLHSGSSHTKKIKSQQYADPINDYEPVDNPPGSRFWKSLSVAMTCLIPDCLIPKEEDSQKLAWREKVTICLIVFFISVAIVGGIGFLPIFLCRASNFYSQEEINNQSGEAWITIFGTIYDVRGYISRHPGGSQGIRDYLGQDATELFPRPPPAALPAFCLDVQKNSSLVEDVGCPQLEELDDLDSAGAFCHTTIVGREGVQEAFSGSREGEVVIPAWKLGEDESMSYVILDKTIYDVSQYIDGLRDEKTRVISGDHSHPNAYLVEQLHMLVTNKLGDDATALYNDLFNTNDYKNCMDIMFYHARVDDRYDAICSNIGIAMYFLLFVVTFMMLIQVFCSLLYLARSHPHFTDEDKKAAVMIMVPCYNETDKELLKTIDSVLLNDYPEENKILTVVADGVITGAGATASTPEILGQILGFEFDCMDEAHEYKSLGENTRNYISVYAGVYEKEIGNGTRRLKYMVLVKQGSMAERGTRRAGNRGKRDSQLAIAGMLNRLHYNREPGELDNVVKRELDRLDIPLKDIEYMMAIDADTRVHRMAMQHMVYHLERNKTVLACCGETQVDNKAQSWVTMMQVFEYFSSHHMKKAFESVFGCVTCLPGCFTMYRLFTEDMNPLISADIIFQEYSRNDIQSLHEKNLYELGEDRMLTTLLLQHFAGMKLSFVPEAICWTIVPHTFSILLSQRRRWINSTLHNMFELLKVETMCGICCISMKTIVIADLLATMILPASIAYLGYLGYLFATQPETIDTFVLYFYAVTIILMMLPFLIRSRWDYFFWFIMYVLFGIPTFYFILPLYSFVHMDDFSWGKTRMVSGGDAATKPATEMTEPLKKEKEPSNETKKTDAQSIREGSAGQKVREAEAREDDEILSLSETSAGTSQHNSIRDGNSGRSISRSLRSRSKQRTSVAAKQRSKPQSATVVEAVSVGTDSGEILVYFKAPNEDRQPPLEQLFTELERSQALQGEFNIHSILARCDPDDHNIPRSADTTDPESDNLWFTLVRRIQPTEHNSVALRQEYAGALCEMMNRISARNLKDSFEFRVGMDVSPEGGSQPLGDHVSTGDAIMFIQDVFPQMALDALAMDRDTIELYFGRSNAGEAKNAILQEMFSRQQAAGVGSDDNDGSSASIEGDSNVEDVSDDGDGNPSNS